MAAPAVDAVVERVANEAIDSVWRQIAYICNYKTNIEQLEQQLVKLKAEKQSMLHSVDEATKNGEEIEETVTLWLKNADDAIVAAEQILKDNDTSKGCCPNLKARYQLSRKAKKKTPIIVQVQQERNSVRKISHRPDVQAVEPSKNYVALESRMEVLKDIVSALNNDDVNLVGVYGFGGVGKTTLVKQQVVAQVKEEGIFKTVAIANVTPIWELGKIQQEIADWLGLNLVDIESTEVREGRLRARLKQEEKVLIILDDIWNKIELEKIGIPHPNEHKGCTILMTSRDLNVLLSMGVESHFQLQVLSEEEGWQLFEKKAGDLKKPNLRSIAFKVACRCAGLPVLLVAVATSLRGKELVEWNDALEQLQKFDGNGMDEQVHSALELSYKFLGDDQKSLLLLCAQLGSGNAPITDLVKYAKGLGLFHKCSTIQVLRNRVVRVVNDLKRSSLLLEGDYNGCVCVKTHEVVRSFAALIASKQHNVFTVDSGTKLEEWPERDKFELCIAISFPHCKIPDLPRVFECPNLESFILYNKDVSLKIPDKFFSKMKKLKLMAVAYVNLLPLPSSLGFLQNLQTLCLDSCVFGDISAIGQLNKLQVLSLIDSNIVQLPMEIKNLTSLQLLDLSQCRKLEVIPSGILVFLTKLEELCMLGSLVRWEGEGCAGKRNNASVSELKTLPKLINIEIHIMDAKIIPADLFHRKLQRFRIVIGDNWGDSYCDSEFSKLLKLNLNAGFELERVKVLLIEIEDLFLDDLKDVENVLPKLDRQGFPELKHLQIQNCHEMQFIIDWTRMGDMITFPSLESFSLLNLNKLEKICNCLCVSSSFNNLKKLKVENCNVLKNLFSFSMFRCLVQLQEINVSQCQILKEIVDVTNEDEDEAIKLTQLHSLTLEDLPQLEYFSSSTNNTSAELLLVDKFEILFAKKIQFPNLVELKLSSINVEKIWHNHSTEFSPFDKLTTFIIEGCPSFSFVFTSSMVRSLAQLKTFEICDCKSMKEVIRTGGETEEEIIFPKLNRLKLKGLPKLVKFCRGNLIQFPSMEVLLIQNCPGLQTFVSTCTEVGQRQDSGTLFDEKVDLPNLYQLEIFGVHGLKVLWGNELREDSFRKLRVLRLEDAKELVKVFQPYLEVTRFQNLEKLEIIDCNALTEVFDIRALIDMKKETGGVAITQLKEVWIYNSPKLKHVWNDDPKGILNFHNLMFVDIRGCPSLESVFPASIARGLANLEKLYVIHSSINEIIKGDEEQIQGAFKLEFPRMKSLQLRRLPQLQTFYPGTHTLNLPALKALNITECNKFRLPTLFQEMFQIILNLEEFTLNDKSVRMIREGQLPMDLFHKLKAVEFNFFIKKSAVFPYDLLHIFPNLETLVVKRSWFKRLFPPQGLFVGDGKHPLILTRMRLLVLCALPNLKTIWNPFLQNIESLDIEECDSLTIVAPSSASFQRLTSLSIEECKGLLSLVTSSTAKSLIQLQKLKLSKCDLVKVIISDEEDEITDEINFIKLKTLELDGLPSLTSFCSGNRSFKFPCLTNVVVNQCPKFEFFSKGILTSPLLTRVQLTKEDNRGVWRGNLNLTISFLHKKMAGFRGLQHLKLSEFSNLKDKWHNELPVEIFCDLTSLVIDEVTFSSYAISFDLLEYLNKLDRLEVNNCELLEEVFDVQGLSDETQGQRGFLSKLNSFRLINLPRLRQVWNEHPRQMFNFGNLKTLKVHNCSSLRMIFTPSMTRGLVQLQEMEVKNCVLVEEIISKEAEEDDMISFPQLNSLVLDSLPELTVFHRGTGIVQCSSLEKITVMDCPNIQLFTSSFEEEEEEDEEEEEEKEEEEPTDFDGNSIFFGKVKCQRIKELRVDWSNGIKNILDGELEMSPKFFCGLKFLELKQFPIEYSTSPHRFLLERSPNLEELVVSDASFEELFSQEDTFNEEENVTHLRRLTLSKLPQLRHLIKDHNKLGSFIQHLEGLEVFECTKLTILVLSSVSFHNLKSLKISKCHGLLYLITSSTARSLSQLTRLEIAVCEMLEEIVASEGVEVEEEIGLSQLKHLQLHCLPKLTIFCSGNESFNFPVLEEVIVRECPNMETFVHGELSTPNLESVQTTEDENEWCWNGSLNATVQKLFKESIAEKLEEH